MLFIFVCGVISGILIATIIIALFSASKCSDCKAELERLKLLQDNNNRCIFCNEIIPEGRQICPKCEEDKKL